jgi:hypothetical protein
MARRPEGSPPAEPVRPQPVTLPDPVITVDVETCEEVTLSWTNVPVSGHVADNWHVQISDDNFVTTLFNNPDYGSTSLTFALAPGTYQARVKADSTESGVNNSGFVIVEFTVVACAAQACSPGFWRQPFHFGDWPSSPAPSDTFQSIFARVITVGQPGQDPDVTDPTLEEALNAIGGDVNRVARIGTAAYLSAVHPDVAYAYTAAEVIAAVQNAIDGLVGPISIDDLENVWKDNPGHCPLGDDPGGAE